MQIKKDDLKYSVLMSLYIKENPAFLKASIQSMLAQTLKPDEIIIVKDGKLNDDLELVIEHFRLEDPDLFTIVALEMNIGLGLALNEGLKISRNELIARMDTDDISLPERCEKQVIEFKKNKKLSIVGTMADEFIFNPESIISSRIVPTEHKEILKFSRRRNPFTHPTVMYKKTSVLSVGGYGNFRRNQDLDLFVRMLNNKCISMNINESLLLFRANEDNLKRRKSWEKCRSYVAIIYSFWRRGYSKFSDVVIIAISQIIIFIMPLFFLNWISRNFLRKVNKGEKYA